MMKDPAQRPSAVRWYPVQLGLAQASSVLNQQERHLVDPPQPSGEVGGSEREAIAR